MAISADTIGRIGESWVVSHLAKLEFTIKHDTKLQGPADIEAIKPEHHLLIQVKTALEPNEPADLTAEDAASLQVRAKALSAIPLLAQLVVNKKGQRVGPIRFSEV